MKKLTEQLKKLEEKYSGIGQDMSSYLEGLLHTNGLSYWEYLQIESLLGLQTPKTSFKDEIVFIGYHQITELYLKLIKLEISELTCREKKEYLDLKNWYKRLTRIIIYFEQLCRSFNVMIYCLDKEEFKQFRMALLPASGFQSAQFREIEIMSSKLYNLLTPKKRGDLDGPLDELYESIYWKEGAFDHKTKDKSLTLKAFEAKYDTRFKDLILEYRFRNLDFTFNCLSLPLKEDKKLIRLLREYDKLVNYHWKMSHVSAISGHLSKSEPGTGGTNWDEYLPPDSPYQNVTFFENVWSDDEIENWGNEDMKIEFREKVSKLWSIKG